MVKEDRTEGEQSREIESQNEVCGRNTVKNDQHRGNSNQKEPNFH